MARRRELTQREKDAKFIAKAITKPLPQRRTKHQELLKGSARQRALLSSPEIEKELLKQELVLSQWQERRQKVVAARLTAEEARRQHKYWKTQQGTFMEGLRVPVRLAEVVVGVSTVGFIQQWGRGMYSTITKDQGIIERFKTMKAYAPVAPQTGIYMEELKKEFPRLSAKAQELKLNMPPAEAAARNVQREYQILGMSKGKQIGEVVREYFDPGVFDAEGKVIKPPGEGAHLVPEYTAEIKPGKKPTDHPTWDVKAKGGTWVSLEDRLRNVEERTQAAWDKLQKSRAPTRLGRLTESARVTRGKTGVLLSELGKSLGKEARTPLGRASLVVGGVAAAGLGVHKVSRIMRARQEAESPLDASGRVKKGWKTRYKLYGKSGRKPGR